jgi:DNA-directed RNA polymerase specialized sigma24 family protein
MAMVIIPFNWNNLPPKKQAQTVPICIDDKDKHGNKISYRWFTEGLAPTYQWMLRLSHRILGDEWRASEIGERAIHALAGRHGERLGASPPHQVMREAQWVAKDIRSERTRTERTRECQPGPAYELAHTDAIDAYNTKLDLELFLKRLREDDEVLHTIAHHILRGHTYQEIAEKLGTSEPAIKMRIARWRNNNTDHPHGLKRRRRAVPDGIAPPGADALSEPKTRGMSG